MVKSVLFLCDRNTVRSPMAAALLGNIATSAGLAADEYVEPFACAVMLEAGYDITNHTPQTIDWKAVGPGTLIIALSVPAFQAARKMREKAGFDLEYWELPAVPVRDGGRDTILDGFRAIRESLKTHIRNRFAKP